MPVAAAVPVPVKVWTVFCMKFSTVPDPDVMPVMAPPLVMLLTRLLETVEVPLKLTASPVTALVPPVQLENVFPVTVFVGAPPFVLLHPAIVVAPVTVIFEKLLLLLLLTAPATSLPLSVNNVTVPPAPVLLNPVSIELLLTFFTPVAAFVVLFEIKITLPVVLTVMLVKVLLLIVELIGTPELMMKVITPDAATV